jgi:hypothetical protein
MAIDIVNETLLGMGQAAHRFPPYRLGRPVNPSTIWRWIREGVVLPSGERVRLEGVRVGGRWLTSVEALARFAAAQTPDVDLKRPDPPKPPASRMRAAQRAGEQLDKIGI